MIESSPINTQVIDSLIRKNISFSIWRAPGGETRFIIQESTEPDVLSDYNQLDNAQGFVMAPFHPSHKHGIVVIKGKPSSLPCLNDVEKMNESPSSDINESYIYNNVDEEFAAYESSFGKFMEKLDSGDISKLVLSRRSVEAMRAATSAASMFFKAEAAYPNSFVYLCNTPLTGTWLGCSPEILLSGGEKDGWRTVALAGTQPLNPDGSLPTSWDNKNREEQRVVEVYINNQLSSLGISSSMTNPTTVKAVSLAHLKTEFEFNLPDESSIGRLIANLHPTPAVCGYPKKESYEFILGNESYDREYYSGFMGYIDLAEHTDLYVNLRCAKIKKGEIILFAGGGLLKTSSLQNEWTETERKMSTIKSIS